jgi:hypothetical protein
MIDAEYEALGGDAFRANFGDAMFKKIVVTSLTKRMQAEMERDPEFKRAYYHDHAADDIATYLREKRPHGLYRQDGILHLGGGQCVLMPQATREHLLAWALREDDERNLAYIKSRLNKWDSHPECKTLAELESA